MRVGIGCAGIPQLDSASAGLAAAAAEAVDRHGGSVGKSAIARCSPERRLRSVSFAAARSTRRCFTAAAAAPSARLASLNRVMRSALLGARPGRSARAAWVGACCDVVVVRLAGVGVGAGVRGADAGAVGGVVVVIVVIVVVVIVVFGLVFSFTLAALSVCAAAFLFSPPPSVLASWCTSVCLLLAVVTGARLDEA